MELENEVQRAINAASGTRKRDLQRLFANAKKIGMETEALQQYRAGKPVETILSNLLDQAGQTRRRDPNLSGVDDETLIRGLCNPSPLNLN